MDQPTVATKPQEGSNPPEHYTLKDEDNLEGDFTLCMVRVDSDEGRAYAKLSTDAERLQYMRLHAHEKVKHVSPQWHFYQDSKAKKMYYIRIRSPEGEEVSQLIGDSDEEVEDGSEKDEMLFRYFREHAHRVEAMT